MAAGKLLGISVVDPSNVIPPRDAGAPILAGKLRLVHVYAL